jgi:hypothetical protein
VRPARRPALATVLVLVAVSLTACARNHPDRPPAASPATVTSTTTPSTTAPTETVATFEASTCALGTAPAAGEITFVRAGQLLGVASDGSGLRCLIADNTTVPQWNGTGDRALFDPTLVLSRPTGKSVLRIEDGHLLKRPTDGGVETDISFLSVTKSVAYHPRGEHIVAVGNNGGDDGIYVATNMGTGAKLVTADESAAKIDQLTWTASGALVFAADHGGHTHLHRLEFPSLRLTTVTEVDGSIGAVAASRFDGAGLAWSEVTDGRCSLRINRGGRVVAPPPEASSAAPVGWLPGGVLVVRDGCEASGAARVRAVDLAVDAPVVRDVAADAASVSVRAVLPVGPGLDLDDVVESQAPA